MRQGGVNSQYLCYRGSRLGLRYPGRPAPEQQRHLVAVMQLQIQQRSRTQSSQLLATRALPSCCRRNNFAYNCAFVVKRALITEQPSAAPVSLICMCDEVSREKGTGRDLFVPGVRRACFVLFCSARGRLSGGSVPLKGIRFEGATAGELTFSPALPFSLRASVAAFNQVPQPCLCSM